MAQNRTEDLENREYLGKCLQKRILIVDGATGTALQGLHPKAADFGGEDYKGCHEMLNLHAPHLIEQTHLEYIQAGADIIETNSFSSLPVVLGEYGVADKAYELARIAAEIACKSIKKSHINRKILVMGSMGPGTKSISVTGGISFDRIVEEYRILAKGLLDGGADILLIETVQDTLNLKAALIGVQIAQSEAGRSAPVSVSVTIEKNGRMLSGQNIEALYLTLESYDLFSLGINCALGSLEIGEHLRTLAGISRFPASVWPNAGLPDMEGKYSEGSVLFSSALKKLADQGLINIAGGCCGTTPAYIKALRDSLIDSPARKFNRSLRHKALAGLDPLFIENDNRPVYIGERTNSIGSRKFKKLITEGEWDIAAEIGRDQVNKGAMALDVCVSDPNRDETIDLVKIINTLQRKTHAPLLIDSTNLDAVESALHAYNGKTAINSINLEDGGGKIRNAADLSKKYNSALVCGLIDDHPSAGMAVTLERKLEVADKIHRILVAECGIDETNIIFDPLVFPAGTGDPQYAGAAAATIEAITLLKKRYPDSPTILGISNVSFGLSITARETINSVMLHLATKAGLDLAIVNTQKLKRYPSIPQEERELAEDILLTGNVESIKKLNALTSVGQEESHTEDALQNPEERLVRAVIDGRHTGLKDSLIELLERMKAIEIINGPLLEGMNEVGKLFADNKLIVAEVLESAEVMRSAVDILKPYMQDSSETSSRGTILLATVKGDVHDIGKNLVDIILTNNGYKVVNLGIKVSSQDLIRAIQDYRPDVIGLSGLLIRSAEHMVVTAGDLSVAGINTPLIVGGAALSNGYVQSKIAPQYNGAVHYASDAMEGLRIVREITEENKHHKSPGIIVSQPKTPETLCDISADYNPGKARWKQTEVPSPPDIERHIIRDIPFAEILPYLNEQTLFSRHLGVKKYGLNTNSDTVRRLREIINPLLQNSTTSRLFMPRCIYRWVVARPEPGGIRVTDQDNGSEYKFYIPRQSHGARISASDWLRPVEKGGDHVCLFVVTIGENFSEAARIANDANEFLESLVIQSLAIELTEAAVEWTHKRIRREWGFPDPENLTPTDILKGRYRGVRLSPGYPAVPKLEDQSKVFKLLCPEDIGITLTECFMMEPEVSVSAIVFHHPEARQYIV